MALLRIAAAALVIVAGSLAAAEPTPEPADDPIPPEIASKPPVTITFTPPPLEGRIVLGIFNERRQLVRTLRFSPPDDPGLKIDTNGYVATWDGRDESDTACPAGRYAAHGFVVGDEVSVGGEAFHFNDWAGEDAVPARAVRLRPGAHEMAVEITRADDPGDGLVAVARVSGDGAVSLSREAPANPTPLSITIRQEPGTTPPVAIAPGAEGTWGIFDAEDGRFVRQLAPSGETLRQLRVAPGEPQPVELAASADDTQLLLLEEAAGGLQRVRLLRRSDKAEERDGTVIADWEVVFERARQPAAKFGVRDGVLVADAGDEEPPAAITVPLVENPLEPGPAKLKLEARAASPGSALFTPSGLKLVEISAAGAWQRFALVPGAERGTATLYQGDGVVVEEFSLTGLNQIAAFDAGSFLLAPAQ